MIQCVAACCSALQHVAVRCSMLQHVAACCSALQWNDTRLLPHTCHTTWLDFWVSTYVWHDVTEVRAHIWHAIRHVSLQVLTPVEPFATCDTLTHTRHTHTRRIYSGICNNNHAHMGHDSHLRVTWLIQVPVGMPGLGNNEQFIFFFFLVLQSKCRWVTKQLVVW